MKKLTLCAGLLLGTAAAAETPVLNVYAPDYFGSEWGPGPGIEAGFEAQCSCDLKFVTGDVLPRLLLEGERTEADVVIGLNTDVTKRARETGLFAAHGQDKSALTLPIEWEDETFLPFNWSYVSFVYDTGKIATPPASFAELAAAPDDLKIVIQDPRTSISGLALLLWVKTVYGDEAGAYWESIAPRIVTVTKGWSEAYGMFTDGEVPMVLSFNTSPAYHIVAEEDETKAAAIFEDGHYAFFELAGKIEGTDQPELADQFMAYVMSSDFQSMIPTTNWSYPAALAESEWPEAFQELPAPASALFYSEEDAAAIRDEALAEWRAALSQ
ncbi:MAG: thiamine ABC transporter substrate binding subunit [Pseudomonadota bacterium]